MKTIYQKESESPEKTIKLSQEKYPKLHICFQYSKRFAYLICLLIEGLAMIDLLEMNHTFHSVIY